MMRFVHGVGLAAMFVAIAAAASSAAAQSYSVRTDASAPIAINAQALTVFYDEHYAEYVGEVRASQGPLHLEADRLQLHLTPANESFSHFLAEDNVRLTSDTQTASGDWLLYDLQDDTMTLGGKVRVVMQDLELEGSRFVVEVAQGRGTLTSDGKARARFYPEATREEPQE